MREMKKRITALLTAICCLVWLLVPQMAYAADASDSSDAIPRVTFTNAPNDSPDLFVTKYVESASDQYQVPEDAEFTFTLKLDGDLVKQREYRVFNSAGQELYKYADGESTEKKSGWSTYKTDRYGTFTLKAGQTAKFEYIGTGTAYEVTEVDMPDHFIQIQPAEGQSLVGTMVSTGARAVFTNLYTEDDKTGTETTLVIRKSVSFPSGYEAPETPDFTFSVKIAGKAWREEAYTLTDMETGEEAGSGRTDSEGRFTMKGGCMATFTGIPVNVDYEVKEILTEDNAAKGWRSTGSLTAEGATAAPVTTAVFSNVQASFAVTKQMEDGSKPDTDFVFELSDAEGNLWQGASYYLYTTAGKRVDETVYTTDAQGRFTLKPGQAAMFVGIPADTAYSVRELAQSGYTQVVPVSSFGYQNKTVIDAVEVLPFVNKKVETYGLSVTKLVESDEGKTVTVQDTFTFVLSRKTAEAESQEEAAGEIVDENTAAGDGAAADTESYEPVANAVYSIESGTSHRTYRTDENGTFTIKANETARFSSLPSGTYRVEEINLSQKYTLKEYTLKSGGTETESNEGVLSGGNLDFTFINEYRQSVLLPETGGPGVDQNWYTLAGALLMLSLLIMYRKAGRKGENDRGERRTTMICRIGKKNH